MIRAPTGCKRVMWIALLKTPFCRDKSAATLSYLYAHLYLTSSSWIAGQYPAQDRRRVHEMMKKSILINSIISDDTTATADQTTALQNSQKPAIRVERRLLSPEEAETAEERAARLETAAELSEDSTYGVLLTASLSTFQSVSVNGKLTGEMIPIKTPGVEQLANSGAKVIITGKSGEMEISVYENGFFIATDTSDMKPHRTVDGVERALAHLGAKKGSEDDRKDVLGMPWIEVLAFDAEQRFDHNEENREADKTGLAIRGDGLDSVEGMKVNDYITQEIDKVRDQRFKDMKAGMRRKLPDALDALKMHSDKQWMVVTERFYTEEPRKVREIADEMGVSEARISTLTSKGIAFLQKYMAKDAELTKLNKNYEE